MRLHPGIILFLFAHAVSWLLFATAPSSALGQTGRRDAWASVDALDAWLATSRHGSIWHDFLQTPRLKAELAKGEEADRAAVGEVLARYRSGRAGLNHPRFVAVRQALEAWLVELAIPPEDQLGELAQAAADAAQPIDPARLQEAQRQLAETAAAFDRFLARGGEAKAQGWRDFLRIEELQAELQYEAPDYDTLVQIWAILAGDAEGLSHQRFVALRESLRGYLELAELFAETNGENGQADAIAQLPQRLVAYQDSPDEQNAAALGQALGWLERTGQGEQAVRAIRYHYARPNLLVDASQRLVVYGFADQIDQTDPVRDSFDGNTTTGTARTRANVAARLFPNAQHGEIRVELRGTSHSNTRTYNQAGVSFNTRGVTQITAEKPVLFTAEGLTSQPATARGTTSNITSNIQAASAQVANVARQRIAQGRAAGEARTSRQVEQRIRRDLDRRVGEGLAEANQRLQSDFLAPMTRRGVQPRLVQYHTGADKLFNTMILAAPEHLASRNDPPTIKDAGDLSARVHTSWINNYGDIVLRGALMTDVNLAEMIEQLRGEVPEELQVTGESDPWDITFASRRPVLFEAEDDRLTVTLRGERFTARDRTMNEPMHISAVYRIERQDGAVRLLRDGDVKIAFPEQGERLPVRYLTLRTFWQTKFGALFEPELRDLNLRLRGRWEAAGPLKLTALGIRGGGWLGLAWEMQEAAPAETAQ